MRIKLTLRAPRERGYIPINYQYPLSSAIYTLLQQGAPEYAKFLHNQGYIGADGKPRKLFTFSRLFINPSQKPIRNLLPIAPNSTATIFVSSPMLGDFIQNFVSGLFNKQSIEINGLQQRTSFAIESVEAIEEPKFSRITRFRSLSPIVVTTLVDVDNKTQTYYYRPLDEGLSDAVRKSLLKKYETVYGAKPHETDLEFVVDTDYINKRGGERNVSKLVALKEGYSDETKVKGFVVPFSLTGSEELMRIAWECGLGDKCSMGFGCVEVEKSKSSTEK